MLTQVRSNVNSSRNYWQYKQEALSAHSESIISTFRKHGKGRQNSIKVQVEIIPGTNRMYSRQKLSVFPAQSESLVSTGLSWMMNSTQNKSSSFRAAFDIPHTTKPN